MNAPVSSNQRFGLLDELADFAERHPQARSAFLCRDAKVEIERLQAELATERMCHESASRANHDHRAERDQLRAALEHPSTLDHKPAWEVVSWTGGPRQRCRTCGWLGLPVEQPVETSAEPIRPDKDPLLAPFGTLNSLTQKHEWERYEKAHAEWEARRGPPKLVVPPSHPLAGEPEVVVNKPLNTTLEWNERFKSERLGELWNVAYHPNGSVVLKFQNGYATLVSGDLYRLDRTAESEEPEHG